MTPARTSRTIQLAIRLEPPVIERLDRLATELEAPLPGMTVTRTDAHRACLLAGLDLLEAKVAEKRKEGKGS